MPKNRNRVLFINQTFGMGGAETFNTEFLSYLHTHGFPVTAFVTYPRFLTKLRSVGIPVHKIPVVADVIGDWKGLVKSVITIPILFFIYIFILLRHRNRSVLIMTGFIEKVIVTPIAKAYGIPVIWWEFSSLEPVFTKFHHLPRLLYSWVEALPDLVLVPSTNTHKSLQKETHIPQERFIYLPIAREVTPLEKLVISQRIVCVSRLEPGKGQDLLIRAFSKISKQFPNASLHIVGEGDFLGPLRKLVSDLNLHKKVTFTGFVTSALAELAAADIVVFPSVWPLEGYGITVLEAMALSKPVIAFPVGAIPDLLTPKTGIILPKGDVPALSVALSTLLSSPSLARSLGHNARNRYLHNFTYKKLGPQYLAIIKSCF